MQWADRRNLAKRQPARQGRDKWGAHRPETGAFWGYRVHTDAKNENGRSVISDRRINIVSVRNDRPTISPNGAAPWDQSHSISLPRTP